MLRRWSYILSLEYIVLINKNVYSEKTLSTLSLHNGSVTNGHLKAIQIKFLKLIQVLRCCLLSFVWQKGTIKYDNIIRYVD